jgi:type III secretion system low calcium response chaperone LcrH/SycD
MTPYLENLVNIQGLTPKLEEIKRQMNPFTPKQMEILYSVAYGYYEQGRYAQAIALFTQLILHHPFDPRFWKGLASNHQMEGSYSAAAKVWATVCLLEPNNPLSHFHAAECFISMGEKEEARKALECSLNRLDHSDPLFSKIEMLKERLRNG